MKVKLIRLTLNISTFLFLITLSSQSAFSNWCDRSYRHENFWISAAASFGQQVQKNTFHDEMCWRLGKKYGESILKDQGRNLANCKTAFKTGLEDGLRGVTQNSDFPAECYNAGVRYGLSSLISHARVGKNVGTSSDCVKNYRLGYNDGKSDIVAQPNIDSLEYTCYMGGFQDAMLFRDLL